MATEKPTPKSEDNPDNGSDDEMKKTVGLPAEVSPENNEVNNQLDDDWESTFDTEVIEDEIIDSSEFTSGVETSEDYHNISIFDDDFNNTTNHDPTPKIINESISDENEIDYTYDENRSYFFVFGPSTTGKTVLLMSLYRYLKIKRLGDSFKNLNDPLKPHERIGNLLIRQFDEYGNTGDFPPGTTKLAGTDSKLPIHLNFKFNPNPQLNKPGFEFCLMDLAGEDLAKIDFESQEPLPESIRTYFEDLPQKHLRFVYVLDPVEEYASKIEQIQLFSAFTNLIDYNNHTNTPVLVLVSKWDTVVNFSSAKDYIEQEYPEIWGQINNPERQIEFGRFSIGNVINKKIVEFDFKYTKNIFSWIYRQHTGQELDEETNIQKEFWIKRIINKLFK